MVQKASGQFEVTEGSATVVSGLVRVSTNISHEMMTLEAPKPIVNEDLLKLSSRDIYKYLRLRGYEYQEVFCGLVSADNHGEYHCMLYYIGFVCATHLHYVHASIL
jgi:fatty acid synthase